MTAAVSMPAQITCTGQYSTDRRVMGRSFTLAGNQGDVGDWSWSAGSRPRGGSGGNRETSREAQSSAARRFVPGPGPLRASGSARGADRVADAGERAVGVLAQGRDGGDAHH